MSQIVVLEAAMLSGWSFVRSSAHIDVYTPPRLSDSDAWSALMDDESPIDVLIVDARGGNVESIASTLIERRSPGIVLFLSDGELFKDAEPAWLVGQGYFSNWSADLNAELYGAPFIASYKAQCWGKLTLGVRMPPMTHGPTSDDAEGEPRLWPDYFKGLGAPISRDARSVLDYLYGAVLGHVPLWGQAGWPLLLSERPTHFEDLEGSFSGVLCASSDKAGAFVVLSPADLLQIAGFRNLQLPQLPDSVLWREVRRAITVPFATTLCEWLDQESSRISRERAPA
jgi:hypothetical protein